VLLVTNSLNESGTPGRRKYDSKSSRKWTIFCLSGSVNFGKHRSSETSFRNYEVPCPATLPLIFLINFARIILWGKDFNSVNMTAVTLSHLPTQCWEPSVPILEEDNPACALTSVPLFWLSAQGKTAVLAAASAFSSNMCSLLSNCPSFELFLCLRHLTSH
jgi:hypothetical protein